MDTEVTLQNANSNSCFNCKSERICFIKAKFQKMWTRQSSAFNLRGSDKSNKANWSAYGLIFTYFGNICKHYETRPPTPLEIAREKELALIEWIEPGVKCDIHVNGEATVRNCTVSAYPYIDKHGNYLCILDELECPQPVETLSPSDDANGDKTATPPNMEEKGQ